MRGNRLIKEIKALQKHYGHDVEILFRDNVGLRDIGFGANVVGIQNDDYVMYGAIAPIGDTYTSQEHIIRDIMAARHYGRYRGYENCTTFPHLSLQEHLAAVAPITGGERLNNDDIPF